ncbi:MAG: hypothetical protein AB7V18_19135 [Pyrinomonadaceae bacterium]
MTAVLLESRRLGSTGWIAVRDGHALSVSGMEEGDRLMASFLPEEEGLLIEASGRFPLPASAKFVQVIHQEVATRVSKVGGVCVDIIRIRRVD